VESYGVDDDAEMVEMSRLKGLQAQPADITAHLSQLPTGSLGGVFSGRRIEHLDPAALQTFLSLAYRYVRPGGTLVCETPNTRSLFAIADTCYRDPTYQKPVHLGTYRFIAQAAGFADVELSYSLEVLEAWAVEPTGASAYTDPSLQALVREVNSRLRRGDEQVFGYQRVALIARKAD